jgi:hypothetical protein
MQSWVNSQEVRQWLQTQIAAEPLPSLRGLAGLEPYGSGLSRHNSEAQLPSAQADAVRSLHLLLSLLARPQNVKGKA